MLDQLLNETKPKMEEKVERFKEELKTIRAGKADSSLIEDLKVSYWGAETPLKQLASVSTPSASLIVITPFDKNALDDIESAIKNSELSLNPSNDGNVIRISLPPLSGERRKELSKLVHDKGEQIKISLRSIRQDCWQKIQKAEKAHKISEDDRYKGEEELNKMIDEFNKTIDDEVQRKESEIMKV